MAISSAWLLDLGSGFRAAVGAQELQHLVDGPQVTRVSSLSAHCNETFVWQGETLSVIDFATWLEAGGALPSESQRPLVGVFAYYAQPGVTPKFGAISLASIPQRIQVNDTQASALPEDFSVWKKLQYRVLPMMGKLYQL